MDEQRFTELVTLLMVLNLPPQIAASVLFWRWRSHARRRWMRNAFLFASSLAMTFVVFRSIAFFISDDLTLRLSTGIFYTAGSYLMIGMFATATRIMERRVERDEANPLPTPDEKTSDILNAVISEMRQAAKL